MSSDHLLSVRKEKLAYGCVFCLTGKELLVANGIEVFNQNTRARAVCQTVRHTSRGITKLQDDVIIKGYVFFEAPVDSNLHDLVPPDDLISVLKYTDGDWRLLGEDEEYAKWIFKYNGVLQLSKAYQINDRICIIDGPLKDLEGQITRIDRRNRSGQVTVNFAGKQHKIWLGFDLVKELPANEKAQASS